MSLAGDLALHGVVAFEGRGDLHAGEDADDKSDCKTEKEPHAATVADRGLNCTRIEG